MESYVKIYITEGEMQVCELSFKMAIDMYLTTRS